MFTILLISENNESLSGLESGLRQYNEIEIVRADSCQEALDMISGTTVDLAVADENITDMTGLDFAKKLVSVDPFTNCAVVSPLPSKDFHEASEGLGVLMQLPVRPDEKQAEKLLKRLKEVLNPRSK